MILQYVNDIDVITKGLIKADALCVDPITSLANTMQKICEREFKRKRNKTVTSDASVEVFIEKNGIMTIKVMSISRSLVSFKMEIKARLDGAIFKECKKALDRCGKAECYNEIAKENILSSVAIQVEANNQLREAYRYDDENISYEDIMNYMTCCSIIEQFIYRDLANGRFMCMPNYFRGMNYKTEEYYIAHKEHYEKLAKKMERMRKMCDDTSDKLLELTGREPRWSRYRR